MKLALPTIASGVSGGASPFPANFLGMVGPVGGSTHTLQNLRVFIYAYAYEFAYANLPWG